MDFNSLSRASMKRKQSNSLLQAFGKQSSRTSAIPVPTYSTPSNPPTATSSHFSDTLSAESHSPESAYYTTPTNNTAYTVYTGTDATSSRAASSTYTMATLPSRSVSGSASVVGKEEREREKGRMGGGGGGRSGSGSGSSGGGATMIKNPDDVLKVVRDRLFSWSYMMQCYQGDIHWFNTVKVSRSAMEASLGPSKVDQRAKNFFILGASLAPLFDIISVVDFLRSLLKLLEEWESYAEGSGGKGVKNLFRGQRTGRRYTGPISDISAGAGDTESLLQVINLPFSPDFFQVHSSTCSIIRDVYKKILGMVLPPPTLPTSRQSFQPPSSSDSSLFHPSTFIHSAPIDSPHTATPNSILSPGGQSVSSQGHSFGGESWEGITGMTSPGYPGLNDPMGLGLVATTTTPSYSGVQHDAFQAMVAGELPPDRTLIGEGQKLTSQVIDLFLKVDAKLKKHFSTLLREGDTLARRVLDDELALLTSSLTTGAPIRFDYHAALSGTGNGWYGISPGAASSMMTLDEDGKRDFGTV